MNKSEDSSLVRRHGEDLELFTQRDTGFETGPPAAARSALPLRALWRYRWSILGIALLIMSIGLVALWSLLEPEYKAEAYLKFTPSDPYLNTPGAQRAGLNSEQYMTMEMATLRQDQNLMNRVVGSADVMGTSWFQIRPSFLDRLLDHRPSPAERLLKDIAVGPTERGSLLIRVAVTVPKPADAALLANRLVDEYLKMTSERYTKKDQSKITKLTTEKNDLEIEIGGLTNQLEVQRRLGKAISPEQLIDRSIGNLLKVDDDIVKTKLEILRLQARLDGLTNSKDEAVDQRAAARYETNAEWRALRASVRQAEDELSRLSQQYSPENYRIKNLQLVLSKAQDRLGEHEQLLDQLAASGESPRSASPGSDTSTEKSPAKLKEAIELLEFDLVNLNERRATLDTEGDKSLNAALAMDSLKNQLAGKETRHKQLKDELQKLDDNIKVDPPISLSSAAVVPTSPDNDKRMKYAVAIVFASFAAGVGLALFRIRLSPEVQELADIEPVVSGSFLGYLPLGPRDLANGPLEWPAYTEAVRMLRTALLARIGIDRCRVVQITSAGPGSGKSTLAAGLARSLAGCGKRVLLIDADFHRPSLSKHFSTPLEPGLANVLALTASDELSIRATDWPGVSLLTAGASPPSASIDAIANGRFRGALDRWRKLFDLIVVDSPPALASADAAILSTHVDGTLVVVRERHCRRQDLVESLAALGAAGGRVLGTVFVGSLSSRSYGYGYGYGYGNVYRADVDARAADENHKVPRRS